MERNRLMSSKDYGKTLKNVSDNEYRRLRDKYDIFLEQPLKLEMFVSVDEVGNLLEEPLQEHYTDCTEEQNAKDWLYNLEKYKQAKNKLLFLRFDGSEFDSSLAKVYLENFSNIEQLSNEVKDQILTKNAIKQLGL